MKYNIVNLMLPFSFTQFISMIFIPATIAEITDTSKPFFDDISGEQYTFHDHTFFYRPLIGLDAAMYVASLLPFNDSNEQKDRIEMIQDFRSEYASLLGYRDILNNNDSLSIINSISSNPNSDERLIEMITQGPGAVLIDYHTDDVFKIDLSDLENYEVRDGLIPYGGCLYFDQHYKLISIKYMDVISYPADNNWEQFKFIFKSSLLVKVVVKMHACEYHVIYGSTVAQSISLLNDGNKLKSLMLPFVYHNLEGTTNAKTILFGENMYFHRLFAFTYESLERYTAYNIENFKYETFIDYKYRLSNEHILNSPYFQDATDVMSALDDYTSQYVRHLTQDSDVDEFINIMKSVSDKDRFELTPKDVQDFLANYMFIGSVNHEMIGNTILKWNYDPSEISFKLRPDSMQADEGTYEQSMLISSTTSINRVPMLMDNIDNQSVYFYKFLESLNRICSQIDHRNTKRDIPFFGAHPIKLESTLSQ